jgi:hypothetical protein
MSDTRVLHRSFAGGEVTPELFGRPDLLKFQTGLALCRNMITLPHGPAVSRRGTQFIREAGDSTHRVRLIPFVVSDDVSYILEFGEEYIRFHSLGGTVLEDTTLQACVSSFPTSVGITTFEVTAHGYTDGTQVVPSGFTESEVPISNFNGVTHICRDVTTDTFTLERLTGEPLDLWGKFLPFVNPGLGDFQLATAPVYEVATPYLSGHLFSLRYAQATGVLTITHPSYAPRELLINAPNDWDLNVIDFDTPVAAPTSINAAVQGPAAGANPVTYSYTATAVIDGQESLPGTGDAVANDLWVAGHRNIISCTATAGADYHNFYKNQSFGVFGFIGSADGGSPSILDQNVTPDTSVTPPQLFEGFDGAGDWPAACAYFEQRRAFGGTNNQPQNMWLTRSGSDSNMSRARLAPLDSDAIEFRVASRQANNIKHIVALDDLLLFTGSVVWRIWAQDSDALTPSTISARPSAYVGASDAQPVVAGNSVLFGEARTGHLAELIYTWEQNGYRVNDASLFAPHLFDGRQLTDLDYTTTPYKIIWAVRSDGVLLGMTYVPEHEVMAWHQHATDGQFESVAVVPEGTQDGTYVVVKRNVDGADVRYIERLQLAQSSLLEDLFYVDSGLSYDGPPATIISGLDHLEGETVSILADGAVLPQQVVTSGGVTLENAASKVHVGLPFVAQLQTLPARNEADTGDGVFKNVNDVHLRVNNSSSIFAGPSFDKLRQFKQRTTEPFGSPPNLFTGVASIVIDPQWNSDGQVCVQQSDPLPLSVLSMSLEVALGG